MVASDAALHGGGWNGYKPTSGGYEKKDAWGSWNARGNGGRTSTAFEPTRHNGPQFSRTGERLDKFKWSGGELVPVNKTFWYEHPNVKNRSEDDNNRMLLEHSICVKMSHDRETKPKPIDEFEELPFPEWAIQGLKDMNFAKPTPIQMQTWPAALWGNDIIGIAETGSGKTMAYVLPMLVHIQAQPELRPQEGPIGLVLIPFREVCKQVAAEINKFQAYSNLRCMALVGGEDEQIQADQLLGRVDIVVATPGRLIGLLEKQKTNLRRATFVVVDEADVLFDSEFAPQIREILHAVRPDRQVLLFSATWGNNVEKVAGEICTFDPVTIQVGDIGIKACKNIKQMVALVGSEERGLEWMRNKSKLDLASEAVKQLKDKKVLVFVNRKETVEPVVRGLRDRQIACEGFGSDLRHGREELLRRFIDPDGDLKVVVSTALLSRGHDFKDLKFVVNYDMPHDLVEYVHRIGRTGRGGKTGASLTFLEESDLHMARSLRECLMRTGQVVERWLEEEAFKNRRRRKPMADAASADTGSASANPGARSLACALPAPAPGGWYGRGNGRRDAVLRQLSDRGVARGRVPVPAC
eukprot:TRINITY_DN74511_c0_g1_i1.p1 TRINITY_DN74511_c0_g1~~TRINITY_DN74511_c0_g1_i1.p1  ORF type:complete len:582 (-),score=119.63 TRINITY_DN74511_c0_g1_i1:157-1902(-)